MHSYYIYIFNSFDISSNCLIRLAWSGDATNSSNRFSNHRYNLTVSRFFRSTPLASRYGKCIISGCLNTISLQFIRHRINNLKCQVSRLLPGFHILCQKPTFFFPLQIPAISHELHKIPIKIQ